MHWGSQASYIAGAPHLSNEGVSVVQDWLYEEQGMPVKWFPVNLYR